MTDAPPAIGMSARQVVMLATLAAIWGASYLLIKYSLESFSPAEIVFIRSALGALTLYLVITARRGSRPPADPPADPPTARSPGASRPPPRWPFALLLGALQITLPFLLISFGERVVPSGLTAVLIAPSPIFVAALAPWLDRSEAVAGRQAMGLVAGLAGVALLVGVETVSSSDQLLGALGIVAATACYALATFVVKRPYGDASPLVTSYVSMIAGALLALPLAALTLDGRTPTVRALLAIIGLGVVGTALAFVIYYRLITEAGAGRASLVSYLTPALALTYGALLLDEKVTATTVAGLALILVGVALASRRSKPAEAGPLCADGGTSTNRGARI